MNFRICCDAKQRMTQNTIFRVGGSRHGNPKPTVSNNISKSGLGARRCDFRKEAHGDAVGDGRNTGGRQEETNATCKGTCTDKGARRLGPGSACRDHGRASLLRLAPTVACNFRPARPRSAQRSHPIASHHIAARVLPVRATECSCRATAPSRPRPLGAHSILADSSLARVPQLSAPAHVSSPQCFGDPRTLSAFESGSLVSAAPPT